MSKWPMPILILICVLVVGLIGCGGEPVPTPTMPPSSEPSSPSSTPSSPDELATVSVTVGQVMVMKEGEDTWSKVSAGTTLEPGDRIKTGSDSNAVVTFFEGSTIELQADTEIGVTELNAAEDTGATTIKLWQEIGKTKNRVEKLVDPASRYEVETPAGSAVVRGSVGDVHVARNGLTVIYNINGRWWAEAQGEKERIPEGWESTIIPGFGPGPSVQSGQSGKGGKGSWSGSIGGGGGGMLAPQAKFSANPISGPAPLTVQFTDKSVGDITSWTWHFGNSGSSKQNPTYTYNTPGIYTVTLKVRGPAGFDGMTKHDYIHVESSPECQAWVQTTVDDFNAGATDNVTVVDVGNGDGSVRLAIDPSNGLVVDQVSSNETYDSYHEIFGSRYEAQTFMAGMTGSLVKVALFMSKVGYPGQLVVDLRNCITTGNGTMPGDMVYASLTTDNVSDGNWYDFFFPVPYAVTANTSYALVLYQESGNGDQQNCYRWMESHYNPYGNGMVWQSNDEGGSWYKGGGQQGQLGQHDYWFKTYLGEYYLSGILESSIYDCGSSAEFCTIYWDAVLSENTTLKFQIATCSDNSTWNFYGPDGTSATYYITPFTDISSVHDGDRYVRYRAYFFTADSNHTPVLKSVSIGRRL